MFGEGVGGAADLQVTDGPAGLQILIAAGFAWVKGDQDPAAQPTYRVRNDASVTLTCTTADGSNPRKDRVIAEVRDTAFGGAANDWRLRIVAGTPAAIPVTPAEPSTAITLAIVDVPAGAATLAPANITDLRPLARIGTGSIRVDKAGISPGLVPGDLAAGGAGERQVIRLVGGVWVPADPIPFVGAGAIPAVPRNGETTFLSFVAGGVEIGWHFVYRQTIDRWLFVGGQALQARVDTSENMITPGTTAYSTLATDGPSIPIPFSGEYLIEFGGRVQGQGIAAAGRAMTSPEWSGHAGQDSDAATVRFNFSEAAEASVYGSRIDTLPAGSDIRLRYKVDNGGNTAIFANRWLRITPRRLDL